MKKKYADAPFSGNGELTEYKNKNDSWVYNQLEKEMPIPGIQKTLDSYGNIKFSSKAGKIAERIVMKLANTIVVDSAYSINKAGISLSFACSIGILEVNDIIELSTMMINFIKMNYSELISSNFIAKSATPYLFAKGDCVYMIWSFSGVEDEYTMQQLENKKIRKIDYEI